MKKITYFFLFLSLIFFSIEKLYFPYKKNDNIIKFYLKKLEKKIKQTNEKIQLELDSESWDSFFQVDRIAYHRIQNLKASYPAILNLAFYDGNRKNILSFIQSFNTSDLNSYFEYTTKINNSFTFVIGEGLFTLMPYIRSKTIHGFVLIQWLISNESLKDYAVFLLDKSNQHLYIPKSNITQLSDPKNIINKLHDWNITPQDNKNYSTSQESKIKKSLSLLKKNGSVFIKNSNLLNLQLGLYFYKKPLYKFIFFYFILLLLPLGMLYFLKDLYLIFIIKTKSWHSVRNYKHTLNTQTNMLKKINKIENNITDQFQKKQNLYEKEVTGVNHQIPNITSDENIYVSNENLKSFQNSTSTYSGTGEHKQKKEPTISKKQSTKHQNIITMTPIKRKEVLLHNFKNKENASLHHEKKIDSIKRKVFSVEVKNLMKDITKYDKNKDIPKKNKS